MPLYSRKDMPQVNTQNLSKALSIAKSKVKVTKGMSIAGSLKPSQKELIKSKVLGISKKYNKPSDMKPLIISKDNYIIDGHHRWGAMIFKFGKDVQIPTFTLHLKRDKAIQIYRVIALNLNESLKEDINIPINVGDTVLGGKFKNKRIVVKSIGKNEKGDITINNKPLLKFRLLPKLKTESIGGTIDCDNCGWSWKVEDGGNDLYICHKCGHDNEVVGVDNKNIPAELPVIRRDGASNLNNSGQYSKVTEIYFDRFGNKCKNPTTLDGRCIDKYNPSTTVREK